MFRDDPKRTGKKASHAVDRKQLLAQSKAERESRQLQKQKASVAVVIQTWYRAHHARKRVKRLHRERYDQRYAAFGRTKDSAIQAQLFHSLPFFYKPEKDLTRLLQLCAIMIASSRPTNLQVGYFSEGVSQDNPALWVDRTAAFADLCLQSLEVKCAIKAPPLAQRPGDMKVCKLLLTGLIVMTSKAKWGIAHLDLSPMTIARVFHDLFNKLSFKYSLYRRLNSVIMNLLLTPENPAVSSMISGMVKIAFTGIKGSDGKTNDVPDNMVPFERVFIGRILSIPLVTKHWSPSLVLDLAAFDQNGRWDALITAALSLLRVGQANRDELKLLSWDAEIYNELGVPGHMWLLGNLVSLIQKIDLKKFTMTRLSTVMKLVTHLLQYTDTEQLNSSVSDVADTHMYAMLLTELPKQLALLVSGSFWSGLFSHLPIPPAFNIKRVTMSENFNFTSALSEFATKEPEYTASILALFRMCLTTNLATERKAAYSLDASMLSFNTPILLMAWWALEQSVNFPLYVKAGAKRDIAHVKNAYSKVGSTLEQVNEACVIHWSIVILTSFSNDVTHMATVNDNGHPALLFELFLQAYLPVLLVLDDEAEFHGVPFFEMGLLRQFTLVIKTVLFSLLWNGSTNSLVTFGKIYPSFFILTHEYTIIQSYCRKICHELYRRDVQHPYMSQYRSREEALSHAEAKHADQMKPSLSRSLRRLFNSDNDSKNVANYSSNALDSLGEAWLMDTHDGEFSSAWKDWWQFHETTWTKTGRPATHVPVKITKAFERIMHLVSVMPYVLSFHDRVIIFRELLRWEQAKDRTRTSVRIRREHVFEDAYDYVQKNGVTWFKGQIRITFQDKHGREEKGIDMGGPFKEFLEILTKRVFEYGMFAQTEAKEFYPTPAYQLIPDAVKLMRFTGMVVGKAILESTLFDVTFASFFLSRVVGQGFTLRDMASYDANLYKQLMFLMSYEGDVADLCLVFAVTEDEFGEAKTFDLKYNGRNVEVTNSTKVQYIYLMSQYYLHRRQAVMTDAFVKGLSEIISMQWIELFNPNELQVLVSGDANHVINVEDWKAHTQYDRCTSASTAVKLFWKILHKMSQSERADIMQFATGCSRPPLMGFAHLQPPFTIRLVPQNHGRSSVFDMFKSGRAARGAVPTASTCFNLLKLPDYSDEKVFTQKLKLAMANNQGFEMS